MNNKLIIQCEINQNYIFFVEPKRKTKKIKIKIENTNKIVNHIKIIDVIEN